MPSDRLPTKQEGGGINFLDRNVAVNLSVSRDVVSTFPDITPEDFETKRERYRILLGKVGKFENNGVDVSIDSVMEMVRGEVPAELEIQEGAGEVGNINLREIKRMFEFYKAKSPELKDLEFLGDMHTHPVVVPPPKKAWHPSQDDIRSVIKNYENGSIDKTKPFIFSIVGLDDETGKVEYVFYRLIFENESYKVMRIFLPTPQ